MTSRLRMPSLTALAVSAALLVSACGNSSTRVTTGTYAGESGKNAPYLNVGPLVYEVQLSRELNPADPEDAAYLDGLTPVQRRLLRGQEWFGVFLQVWNHGATAQPAATNVTISDTQDNVYSPLVPAETNLYAYRGGSLRAQGMIPEPGTPAALGATQGALLLYKINVVSLDNRPLEIKIVNPSDEAESASAETDV